MELTVFGATGGTGRQVVRQALAAGHHVTAVVRDPARLGITGPRLDVVTADVTDPQAIGPAVARCDAIVSALGAPARKQAGICATGTRAILRAMNATGVRRLAAVSAAPVGPVPPDEAFFTRAVALPLLKQVLRDVYADMAAMEDEIRHSAADWTVLRPPRLTDKPLRGTYRTVTGGAVPRGSSISRADLAHAILALLDDPAVVKTVVGVAY